MTRAKKFEATTYLRTDNLESIADLAHDLDVKAREYARGLPSAAAQTARDFLEQVQGRMEDRGSTFKSASRELAYA